MTNWNAADLLEQNGYVSEAACLRGEAYDAAQAREQVRQRVAECRRKGLHHQREWFTEHRRDDFGRWQTPEVVTNRQACSFCHLYFDEGEQ